MAPEVVDLISDDEDVDVASGSSSNTRTHSATHQANNQPPQTINPSLLSRPQPSRVPSDTNSSTASSHTARNSPGNEASTSRNSPLSFPSPKLEARDVGKGKGRANPSPEIDLSQDTEDVNTATTTDPTWEYANGEFTEEDALKQAIALSLQESTPEQVPKDEHRDVGADRNPTTLPRKGSVVRGAGETGSSLPAGHALVKTLPNWHASPTKDTPIPTPDRPVPLTSKTPPIDIRDTSAVPITDAAMVSSTMSAPKLKDRKDAEPKPSTGFSFAGLNRQQMEQERLARLKRKHEGIPDEPEQPAAKAAKVTQVARDKTVSPPPLRQSSRHQVALEGRTQVSDLPPSSSTTQPTARKSTDSHVNPPSTPSETIPIDDEDAGVSAHAFYPEGVALKTYIEGFPATRTITFPDLITPASNIESALLSSFIWNFDWLLPQFDTRRTRFQLVMHAKSPAERQAIRNDWAGVPNVRLTLPPMEGNVNCMHSKLMLLFYKDEDNTKWKGGHRCRIVVPTANLVDFDWGVGGYMENTVWLIDLPLKAISGVNEETPFQKSLKRFLAAQTVPDDVAQKLDLFDFSKTVRYGFVHTIGGMHSGQAWKLTGLCGLGRTITELGLATKSPLQVDYVTSSVGSLNDDFLSSMYLAAQGDNGKMAYNGRVNKRAALAKQVDGWEENLRLYFPSDGTVKASKGGARRAGTICFSTRWWENPNFPRSNMFDCVSVRWGLLMHNKVCDAKHGDE